jgi:hypothetical protein
MHCRGSDPKVSSLLAGGGAGWVESVLIIERGQVGADRGLAAGCGPHETFGEVVTIRRRFNRALAWSTTAFRDAPGPVDPQ